MTTKKMKRSLTAAIGIGAAASLALAGCSGDAGAAEGAGGGETITVGYLPDWADAKTAGFLVADQLERLGYNVEMEQVTEVSLLYTGVAQGDIDIYASAWPEAAQADYWNEYSDRLETLNTYYDNGIMTLAVPDYVDIESIEDLAANPEMFDGEIIGIEPGAGQTQQIQNSAMPAYGLDENFELVTSSFTTMLATLQEAVENEENIVVSQSRPHWANATFDLRDLEDPLGAMGEPESLQAIATKGFSEEFPEAAELIGGIHLEDEVYTSLENRIMNEFPEGDEDEAVRDWLNEYPDAFDTIITD